jgi:hypothetical protein
MNKNEPIAPGRNMAVSGRIEMGVRQVASEDAAKMMVKPGTRCHAGDAAASRRVEQEGRGAGTDKTRKR